MEHNIAEMPRPMRRRWQRVVQRSRDKDYVRRALVILQLRETGGNVPVGCSAMHLSLYNHVMHNHVIDHFAAVGRDGIVKDLRAVGVRFHLNDGDVKLQRRGQRQVFVLPLNVGKRERWAVNVPGVELQIRQRLRECGAVGIDQA